MIEAAKDWLGAGGTQRKSKHARAWEEVTSPLAPFVLTRVHDWLSRLCAAMASAEALRSTLPQMSQTAAMYGKLVSERHVLGLGLAAGAVCGGLCAGGPTGP